MIRRSPTRLELKLEDIQEYEALRREQESRKQQQQPQQQQPQQQQPQQQQPQQQPPQQQNGASNNSSGESWPSGMNKPKPDTVHDHIAYVPQSRTPS